MMDSRKTGWVSVIRPLNGELAAVPAAGRRQNLPSVAFDETWIPPAADTGAVADSNERLPMGAALSIILLLSLGLWGLTITVVLWLIRVM
jgi:hypothetical protein